MLDIRKEDIKVETAVLVLNWQGEKLIRDCLDALRDQDHQDFLTVVADNASTDASVEIIKADYPDVLLYDFKENYGFARGNNEAMELLFKSYPDLKYIVLLNNDTKVEKQWLAELVKTAESDQKLGSVASQLLCWDGEHAPAVIDSAGDMFFKHGVAGKRGYGKPRDTYTDDAGVFGACAGAALYRVQALKETGLFDPDFFAYNEDVDLAFRLRLRGWGCRFNYKAAVWHRVGFSTTKYSDRALYWAKRNSLWVVWKDFPTPLLWRYGLGIFLYAFLSDLLWTARGRLKPIWQGRRDAIKAKARLDAQRKEIQANCAVSVDELKSLMILKTPWMESILRNLKDPRAK